MVCGSLKLSVNVVEMETTQSLRTEIELAPEWSESSHWKAWAWESPGVWIFLETTAMDSGRDKALERESTGLFQEDSELLLSDY